MLNELTPTTAQKPPRRKTLDTTIAFRASKTLHNRLHAVAAVKGISASSLALWLVLSGLDNAQREMMNA